MTEVFGGIRAPSTLGSFLRSFTWGNVRQLDAVDRRLLTRLAPAPPLLPGGGVLAFIDMDSMQKRVYAKDGAGSGHTKIQGKSLMVRGLNALAAAVATSLATEAISTARQAGCTGQIVVRIDPAYYSAAVPGHDPRRRGVLLGHRADGPQDPRRDRRHPRGRLDARHLPAGGLG